ncbi:hypothetical protein BSR03_22125 [Serratia proteamaculans]|nr:hypothetical protein BSR03_22125 [Serratia proteamaculans]
MVSTDNPPQRYKKRKNPTVGAVRVFLLQQGKCYCVRNYKRILMRLTMKNGLTLDAPVTKEMSSVVGWGLRAVAVCVVLYGVAQLITAVTPLIDALK